jgi:hypothetical protein
MSYLIRASFTKAHSEALMQQVCVRARSLLWVRDLLGRKLVRTKGECFTTGRTACYLHRRLNSLIMMR